MGIFVWFAYAFFDRQFKLSNIKREWPKINAQAITQEQKNLLKEIVSAQSFHYLDRGKQSFVFESQDGRYVLKFFDARCLRSGDYSFFFSINKDHCAKKLKQLFEGYQVALNNPAVDAGILVLQLAPDPFYTFQVKVVDRFGVKHEIDLAEIPFVLQEKAIPLRELITTLLNDHRVDEVKKRLRLVVDMYVKGYQEGIVDLDHNFMYNTGFVANYPIRIDLGRLKIEESVKDPRNYGLDLEKVMYVRLGSWLERHFPKHRKEILDDMKNKIEEVSNGDIINNFNKLSN